SPVPSRPSATARCGRSATGSVSCARRTVTTSSPAGRSRWSCRGASASHNPSHPRRPRWPRAQHQGAIMKRTIIGSAALLGASALVLAGCGSASDAGGDSGAAAEGGELRVWLVGTDTPDEARQYLVDTFESENEGWTLTLEQQQWTGLVDLLTTSLSGSGSPDVVEVGNSQAAAVPSAGACLGISDMYDSLGRDDLLPGFVEAGTYDGTFYAAPYYSGSRVVFYNTEMYDKAGLEEPTTLGEYIENAEKL